MDDHENSCAFLIHDTTRLIQRRFDLAFRDVGLTQSKWRLLSALNRNPGISQSELAELLDIEKAPLGLTLEWLEQAHWIRREAAPEDRRVRRVFPQEQGQAALTRMNERFRAIETNYLRGFDDDEIQQMLESLRIVRDELRADAPPAGATDAATESSLDLLFECARLLTRRFDARLADLGYTRNQWLVLNTVLRREGSRQTEIAEITEIAVAPLGKIIDALEKANWLERKNDPSDRRANRLHVTRRAKHMLQGMLFRFEQLHESAMRPLGEERQRMLISRLGWIRYRLLEESSIAVESRRSGALA